MTEPIESTVTSAATDTEKSDDYKVGPGRPPKASQWKKGGRSPNPKGRPRKPRSMLPDLKKAFEDALNSKVSVTLPNGSQRTMTKWELGMDQWGTKFAKGDRDARRDAFTFAAQLGVDLKGTAKALADAIATDHQRVIDAYIERNALQGKNDNKRVIAPDDLLDDDVEK